MKQFHSFTLSSLFIFLFLNAFGTDYYISNNGNDDENNGLSPETPWKTIAKVNATTLIPGDHVYFERSGVWREELIITQSGNENNYIEYSSYGEGKKPQILGSARIEDWTEVETNIWKSVSIVNAPRERTGNSTTNHPASIFFNEKDGSVTWGNMEAIYLNSEGAPKDICECERDNGFTLMDKEYDWCWEDDHIYVYAPENPAVRYSFIEVPQRSSTIKMNSHEPQQYIEINGLELLYALKYGFDGGWPMNQEVQGLNIKNCHIGYMGTKGAASAIGLQIWHSDMLVQNNEIHDCGRRNISYNVYGDLREEDLVFKNVLFENNTLYHGYHTTGFDISAGYTDEFKDFIFRDNFIWDDPADNTSDNPNDFSSMGMFLNSGSGTFNNFKVYNNVFLYIKQKHIAANELNNSFISFNTFYGMNVTSIGSGYRQIILVSGSPENFEISNNIFQGNVNNEYVLSGITFSGSSVDGITMNNNLYYQDYESQRMVTVNITGESYKMNEWEQYLTDTGWDNDAPEPSNPDFTNAPYDLTLTESSPAKYAGYSMTDITTDITGAPRATKPSIGAYEYGSLNSNKIISGEKEFVKIFPNPSNGRILIDYNRNEEGEVDIFNINGQLVKSAIVNKSLKFDLPEGIYFIKITADKMNYTQKIIIK